MASSWSDDHASDASESEESLSPNERREVELERFRQQWKGELAAASKSSSPPSSSSSKTNLTPQEMAARLYEQGVKEERRGRMFEAIKFYRDAVHLVPDIEQKMAQSAGWGQQEKDRESSSKSDNGDANSARSGLDHLLREWNRVLALPGADDTEDEGESLDDDEDGPKFWKVCVPENEALVLSTRGHISYCPSEVIALILRWVVSRDLDVRSLDLLSGVSRGFYQASRDPELWKRICVKVWGNTCELPEELGFASWRDMYLGRPHPLFHGCYIGKVSYVRHGESSFQDQFYRPWYQVDYFRYLRFFPDGKCLMLTTPDDPTQALPYLKHRNPRLGTTLFGQYRLHGDTILATMRRVCEVNASKSTMGKQISRARRNRTQEERVERTFYLELQVKNVRSRRNAEIVWNGYSVWTYYTERKVTQKAEFELRPSSYPPCRFSRVKSYATVAEHPLEDD